MKKLHTVAEVIDYLESKANADFLAFKAKKYNIQTTNALGVSQKEMGSIARQIEKTDALALELFDTGIYECKILCSKIYNPKHLNKAVMDKWVKSFDNWEICDSFCLSQFAKSNFVIEKVNDWSIRKPEFEKRSAFATIAGYCMADKNAENSVFESFFPLMKKAATDERIYVKKAVDWALRNTGKRNVDLRREAIALAKELTEIESKASQWIGRKALKELQKENVRSSDYPREIYRPKSEMPKS